MNKYEELFIKIVNLYDFEGVWIKNEILKIGFSYLEITEFDSGHYLIIDETENFMNADVSEYEIKISDYFKKHSDLKFCFTTDKAIDGNFISWKEFCKRIDNGESLSDVFSL